jgi:hypothetical protein
MTRWASRSTSSGWVQVDHFATCNRCGAKDLVWQQSKRGKWYLVVARRRGTIIEAGRRAFHECHASYTPPFDDEVPRSRVSVSGDELRWMQEIIAAGYRTLASKHHPDHGGKTGDMQTLNAAVEKLRAGVSA